MLFRSDWDQAVETLHANVFLEKGFEEFVAWSKSRTYPVKILSSGMTPVVELYAGHLGIPIYAHHLEVSPEGWRFEVIERHRKEKVLRSLEEEGPIVYIGDGTSDLAAIPFAELLFARRGRYLESYCAEHGIPCIPYSDFNEVRTRLEEWIGTPGS